MTTLQIINTIFSYVWLIAILVLGALFVRLGGQILTAIQVLNMVSIKNAESSEKSAQAAQKSAEAVVLLLKEKPPA